MKSRSFIVQLAAGLAFVITSLPVHAGDNDLESTLARILGTSDFVVYSDIFNGTTETELAIAATDDSELAFPFSHSPLLVSSRIVVYSVESTGIDVYLSVSGYRIENGDGRNMVGRLSGPGIEKWAVWAFSKKTSRNASAYLVFGSIGFDRGHGEGPTFDWDEQNKEFVFYVFPEEDY